MTDVRAVLSAACKERGITSAAEFERRFGIAPAALTASSALVLVTTPLWVMEKWLPNATDIVVYVPQAVRAYAAAFGLNQTEHETDHEFNARIRARVPLTGACTDRNNVEASCQDYVISEEHESHGYEK